MSRTPKLGQHFLMHARIAERIVHAARLSSEDSVLEVGPGKGILTRPLLAAAKKVIAVETDPYLAEALRGTFAEELKNGKLELIEGDIRDLDLARLPKKYRVVANIPYYLTGDLIRRMLESEYQPGSLTLLVQKEVAERIVRAKKESILSLSVKAYGVPSYEFTVPRGAFNPSPKIDSAVFSVREISRNNFVSREQEKRFFEIVRAGFAHKRKYLSSNMKEAGFSTEGILEKVRAEDLKLSDWFSLAGR